jgi:hypothetical protein
MRKELFPGAACCPVLRVDIFETQGGLLVLNEFESIEALTDAVRGSNCNKLTCVPKTLDAHLETFRTDFF